MRYLYVMLTSLFENNQGEDITIYVMQRDFSDGDKENISNLMKKYGQKIEFLFVDEKRFKGLPTNEKFSLETYFRLMMTEILPLDVEKVLYLDVDIIVRKNLREFYTTDIDNYIAAVCQDADHPTLTNAKERLFHRSGDMRYFNAGVMLWNVKRLRENYSFQRFLDAAADLGYQLQCADQEILNYLLYDQVLYIGTKKYNYLVRGERRESDLSDDEAFILHYATISPWQAGSKGALYRIWWRYAKDTPFYQELLEEQLWEECGQENNTGDRRLQDTLSMEIYEEAFRLKCSGLLRAYIEKTGEQIGIYGTGTMGEVLFELFESEGMWDSVKLVADRNRNQSFHGVKAVKTVDQGYELLWIVTPTLHTSDIVKELNEKSDGKIRIIAIKDWLKSIV